MLGMIFDLDKSNVMRDIKYLEPAIKQSIPIPAKKYADAKKLKTIQELQQFFPELIVITDGTEQLTNQPRPKDRAKRKSHYSGKKKKHTVQNQITVNLDGVIIHKSTHSPGSHHDYKIYKAKHPVLSEELLQFYDLGFGNSKAFQTKSAFTIQEKEGQRAERIISKGMEQIPI